MRVGRGSEEGTALGEFAVSGADAFVWRSGRAEIILSRADESWTVVYTSTGRLLGPRQILYQGKHRDATYAAWDVMARVVLASRDEDEGLRAGRSAAQWIKAQRRRQGQRSAESAGAEG
jgi:hypothetical protein